VARVSIFLVMDKFNSLVKRAILKEIRSFARIYGTLNKSVSAAKNIALSYIVASTVNSAYNGSAYKELSVIRNRFSFPDLYPSLFDVKNMDIADSVIRNYRLEGTHFPVPMLINQCKFIRLVETHFWSS